LKDGLQTAVALIDHSRRNWSKRPAWKSGPVPRILLNRTMGLSAELRIGRKLTGAAKELRSRRRRETEPYIGEFLEHAAANAASPGSFAAMRIGEQVNELVRALRPKAIVTTFEGHSWERLAFHAARAAKPDIVCVGYHHAVLFPFADAMRQSLDHGFDPDHILTAGQVSCDWLRTQPSLKGIPVEVLGSVRAPSDIAKAPRSGSTCLVIPEGLLSESMLLCHLAIEAARLRSNLNFRLRLHPLISRKRLTRIAPDLANLPANVVWSDVALSADLAMCRWALYRGSSAVITATLSGLRPFYFSASHSEVSIDPLAALAGWREIISSAEELSHTLDTDLAMSDTDRQSGHDQASNYCRKYFMPLNAAALTALLPH
jgi:hypothetical protein